MITLNYNSCTSISHKSTLRRCLQNVSRATFSHLHLWKHSRNAIPQQRGLTSSISSAFLNVRGAIQYRVQVSQLRADEPLSSRDVPSISKSHRSVLDRKVGERYGFSYIYVKECGANTSHTFGDKKKHFCRHRIDLDEKEEQHASWKKNISKFVNVLCNFCVCWKLRQKNIEY